MVWGMKDTERRRGLVRRLREIEQSSEYDEAASFLRSPSGQVLCLVGLAAIAVGVLLELVGVL